MIIKIPPKLTNRDAFIKYIEVDLWSWLRELFTGIQKINFEDNFTSFTVENLTIKAGVEIAIPNNFRSITAGGIPSGRIITRQRGDANIIDGIKPWTPETVYLLNPSVNDVVISVIFFK